ncbi:DUF4249 family protein [Gemmatimonas phototrophica]|uniref:DUF4249 domain-containing protein n=1 Tax=Gemmatimonas phototrophica TaxID=1379270 RepID=A0A143BHJ1_9BACT|nr:DUF4249 family protein [Gemmatimonas phototrophica]AMW03920.1 hypothetical protein GEMMAAP_01815 [Gemmatimonas phototrophica]
MWHTHWHAATVAAAGCLSAVLTGCESTPVEVASPTAAIVIHAVLNPDVTEQVILVESSLTGRIDINDDLKFNPLDPIRTAGGAPISGAEVRLLTEGDSVGVRAAETLVGTRGTGRYVVPQAALAVQPGRRYQLRVRTGDGREVTGTTLVPGAPAGWTPGAGAVATPVLFDRGRDTLQLRWPAVRDARTYAIRVETPYGPWALFADSTQFTLGGGLRNFFADGLPSVWLPGFVQIASVVAVDANFYDYNRSGNDPFGGTGLISSVRGGIGLFGSVVNMLRREVSVTERQRFPLDARWRGTTSSGGVVEMDLWVDVAGPTVSSVSGREVTTPRRYLLGTLRGETLRLVTLAAASSADTVSVLSARLAGDSLVGSYDTRFATTGPRVFRRIVR